MSPNLLGMAKDLLGDSVMEQLGGVLGEDSEKTKAAVGAGLPTILGGLIGKMNEPGGADAVFGELDNHDGGILDSFGDMLSGGNQSTLLKVGGSILAMLLGSKQGGVVGTLTRMLGMGDGKIGSLLGALAPFVMGMLSKQRAATPGFNAGSLKQMLFDQKDHLAAELPAEMRTSLGLGDFFDDDAAAAAPRSATPVEEKSGGGIGRFLPWIILAALGLLAWNFLSGNRDTTETPRPEVSAPKVDMPAVGNLDALQSELGGAFSKVTGALTSVTDLDSARSAATSLGEASTAIDGMQLDQLPAAAKSGLQPMIAGFVNNAEGALELAYKIPGVRDVLEPIAGPLLSKLSNL